MLQASSREEHPAWFADLSTNAHTKEEFMNKNCQAGIHSRSTTSFYLYSHTWKGNLKMVNLDIVQCKPSFHTKLKAEAEYKLILVS